MTLTSFYLSTSFLPIFAIVVFYYHDVILIGVLLSSSLTCQNHSVYAASSFLSLKHIFILNQCVLLPGSVSNYVQLIPHKNNNHINNGCNYLLEKFISAEFAMKLLPCILYAFLLHSSSNQLL